MSFPQLPTELVYTIIERAWSSSQLTPAERIRLMLSSKLVSKIWSLIYDDVFSYDIHIPSKSFYYHLFNDVALSPSYGNTYFARCRRITFTVSGDDGSPSLLSHDDDDDVVQTSEDLEQTKLRFSLKFMSRFDLAKLPCLQSLNIVYYNAGFPDPCVQGFFFALPEYLPYMSVSYTFSSDISTSIIEQLRKTFTRELKVRYAQPKVGTLDINGADEYIAAIWESLFPDRKKLIRDGKEEKQKLIPVHTEFDDGYAIEELLSNLYRTLEFQELSNAKKEKQEEEEAASHAMEIGTGEEEDEERVLPPAPDVSRSPTERSVEVNVSVKDRRKKATSSSDGGGVVEVWENEAQGVKFISSISPDKMNAQHPLNFPSFGSPGDVGYFNSVGMFSPLFNALEPYVGQGSMIPSLHGYGQVGGQDSPANATKKRAKNRVFGAFLKVWKPRGARKNLDKNVAETWFKANADRVVNELGVGRESLVLVVGYEAF